MSDLVALGTCIARVKQILADARAAALRAVNEAMVAAYWEIGQEIVEEEQRGAARADYGTALLKQLSAELSAEFGRGFSTTNLKFIRKFYLVYRDRRPRSKIGHSASDLSKTDIPMRPTTQSAAFLPELSWTHYRVLMGVTNPQARSFYEVECARAGWAVRELERQIGSFLFERLAGSRDKEGVLALAREGHQVTTADDLIKDPYVLEFVGLPERPVWREQDLEQALIDRLQQFLLELGSDLFFVARQKRITVDGDHFYIDLVFYHRTLRSFLLIDLKTGKLTHQDIGQMLFYTGYYQAEETREGENPPIGLILCADKNEPVVRYTISQAANNVFASRYMLHLPTEEELVEELKREREQVEVEMALDDEPDE